MTEIEYGRPITTQQAVKAILSRLDTPIIDTDDNPSTIFSHIYGIDDIYHMLSSGEKHIADLALSIHQGKTHIGGMDRDNRRYCLSVMAYLYLGLDYPSQMSKEDFERIFES
jgi:hypothetical protein